MSLLENVPIARRTMVLFFVTDTSGSMSGVKIGALNDAVRETVPDLRDLSSNGLRMSGSQLLKVEALHQLCFHLDDVKGDDGKRGSAIECAAQVLWVRADGVSGLYITGLRIFLMSTEVAEAIKAWARRAPQK